MPKNPINISTAQPPSASPLELNLDPASISGVIFWGVLAGVLTSGFMYVCSQFFWKVFIPWYLEIRYEGIDLRGQWIAQNTLPDGTQYAYTLELEQSANDLRGVMTIVKSNSPNNNYSQSFKVSGSTWEGYITLNMKSVDRRSLSFAASLLQVKNRGSNLVGHMAYRSAQHDRVDSEAITWTKS